MFNHHFQEPDQWATCVQYMDHRSKSSNDNIHHLMKDEFFQTLMGHLGGFEYVTQPTPNTFTSKVPVKLNKGTLPHAQKVNTLNYGFSD